MSNELFVPTNGGGWEAVPQREKQARAKYSDGEWTGPGGDRINGAQYAAVGVETSWIRWEDKRPVERLVTRPGQRHPHRDELGHDDESKWERGPGGGPSDPWRDSREVKLVDPKTGAELIYSTSTFGGRDAVALLSQQIGNVRVVHPTATPIIELDSEKVSTKYGMKPQPRLTVVGWVGRPVEEKLLEIEADEGLKRYSDKLDDEIPF